MQWLVDGGQAPARHAGSDALQDGLSTLARIFLLTEGSLDSPESAGIVIKRNGQGLHLQVHRRDSTELKFAFFPFLHRPGRRGGRGPSSIAMAKVYTLTDDAVKRDGITIRAFRRPNLIGVSRLAGSCALLRHGLISVRVVRHHSNLVRYTYVHCARHDIMASSTSPNSEPTGVKL